MQESLVNKEAFFAELSPLFLAFRAKTLALPAKVSQALNGLTTEEITSFLQDEMRELLRELAQLGMPQ